MFAVIYRLNWVGVLQTKSRKKVLYVKFWRNGRLRLNIGIPKCSGVHKLKLYIRGDDSTTTTVSVISGERSLVGRGFIGGGRNMRPESNNVTN